MSNKTPPQYTFRRPKPSEYKETYTKVSIDDLEDKDKDRIKWYAKYTFILLLLMFVMMSFTLIYTYKKGLPVNIKG